MIIEHCELGTVLDIYIVYLDLKAVLYILVIPLLQIRKLIYREVKSPPLIIIGSRT